MAEIMFVISGWAWPHGSYAYDSKQGNKCKSLTKQMEGICSSGTALIIFLHSMYTPNTTYSISQ